MEKRDWAQTIRRRNTRELVAAGVIGAWVLWSDGLGFRSAPLLGATAFVALVLLTVGRWRTSATDGEPLGRELKRQGRLLQLAWFWYVAPLFGASVIYTLSFTKTAIFGAIGAFVALVNFIVGTKLVREGRRVLRQG